MIFKSADALAPFDIQPTRQPVYDIFAVGAGGVLTRLLPPVTVDQRQFPNDDTDGGMGFENLGVVTLPAGSTLRIVLHNGGSARESILAGPVRAVPVAGGTATRIQRDRYPSTLAPIAGSGYSDSDAQWKDLTYQTGTGNFPLWESTLLRPVFRALFKDWQNGALQFPDLGDTPSDDPNATGPGPAVTPGPYVTPFDQPAPPAPPSGLTIVVTGAQTVTLPGGVTIASITGNGDGTPDSLVLLVAGDLTLTGPAGGGGLASLTINADGTITVLPGVVIFTRQIAAGANPFTAPSTGSSGNVLLRAKNIRVGSGAAILANADNGFTSGDVTLEANRSQVLTWFAGVIGFTNLFELASVEVGEGAAIRGRDIRLSSRAANFKSADEHVLAPADFGRFAELAAPVQTFLAQFHGKAIVVVADARALTEIGGGATVTADRDLTVEAHAEVDLLLRTLGRHFGLTFGSATPTAEVSIMDGVLLTAGRSVDLHSSTGTHLDVAAVVPDGGDVANLSVAFGNVRATSTTLVRPGALINALTVTVSADNSNSYSTTAVAAQFLAMAEPDLFGTGFSAGIGAAAAIGFYQSSASASVAGTVNATNLTVRGTSENTSNQTRAFASISSPAGASELADALRAFLGTVNLTTQAGGRTFNPNGPGTDIVLAGAVTLAESENKAAALLDDGAWVRLAGSLTIDSHAIERFRGSAVAHANQGATGVAGAVIWSRLANQATSFIGYNAAADVVHTITITSTAEVRSPVPTFDPAIDLTGGASGTGLDRIGSELAAATTAAIAGGVNYVDIYNLAASGIAPGARVNQHGLFAGTDQDVALDARASVATVNIAGLPSALTLRGAGGAPDVSVGGYWGGGFIDNYARATIDDLALVRAARDVSLHSLTDTRVLDVVVPGVAGGDVAVDGSVGVVVLGHESIAAIEDRAAVDAGRDIALTADNATIVVNLAGAPIVGAGTGVGVAVALTVLARPRALADRAELEPANPIAAAQREPVGGSSVRAFAGNAAKAMGPTGTGGARGKLHAGTGSIRILARNDPLANELWTAAVAGTPSTGATAIPAGDQLQGLTFGFGLSAEVAANVVERRTQAYVRDLTDAQDLTDVRVTAAGEVHLEASDSPLLVAAGGTVGASSTAIGGSFADNHLTDTVSAFTQDVTLAAATITVLADSHAIL